MGQSIPFLLGPGRWLQSLSIWDRITWKLAESISGIPEMFQRFTKRPIKMIEIICASG